jgi:hypothetical protein
MGTKRGMELDRVEGMKKAGRGTFFCKGHLDDIPLSEQSLEDPRYCAACYKIVHGEPGNGKKIPPEPSLPLEKPVTIIPATYLTRGKPRQIYVTRQLKVIKDLRLTCREAAEKIGSPSSYRTIARIRKASTAEQLKLEV